MEIVNQVDTTEKAHQLLRALYTEATNGEIANPDSILTGERQFPEGSKFKISRINRRIYIRVIEKDGTNIGFGLNQDGLSDISFTDSKGNRYEIKSGDLDIKRQIRFKATLKDLTPWFIERYESEKAKPLPAEVIEALKDSGRSLLFPDLYPQATI